MPLFPRKAGGRENGLKLKNGRAALPAQALNDTPIPSGTVLEIALLKRLVTALWQNPALEFPLQPYRDA